MQLQNSVSTAEQNLNNINNIKNLTDFSVRFLFFIAPSN